MKNEFTQTMPEEIEYPIEIQRCEVGSIEFENDDDYINNRLDFDSPDWETFEQYESTEVALNDLINKINDDELNDVEYFYRAVNNLEKRVIY